MSNYSCADLMRELEPPFRWGTSPLLQVYPIWADSQVLIDSLIRPMGIPKSSLEGESSYSSSRVALDTFNKTLEGMKGLTK